MSISCMIHFTKHDLLQYFDEFCVLFRHFRLNKTFGTAIFLLYLLINPNLGAGGERVGGWGLVLPLQLVFP